MRGPRAPKTRTISSRSTVSMRDKDRRGAPPASSAGRCSTSTTSVRATAASTTPRSCSTLPGQRKASRLRCAASVNRTSRRRCLVANALASGTTSSRRSRSGGSSTQVSTSGRSASGSSLTLRAVNAIPGLPPSGPPAGTVLRSVPPSFVATHDGSSSTWLTTSTRPYGWVRDSASVSNDRRPTPSSPTTATTRPAASAASTSADAVRQPRDRGDTDVPGGRRNTRNTWPCDAARGTRPRWRASIIAAVLLAALWASASSSLSDCCAHVVRLIVPARSPDTGSSTGAAAHV